MSRLSDCVKRWYRESISGAWALYLSFEISYEVNI